MSTERGGDLWQVLAVVVVREDQTAARSDEGLPASSRGRPIEAEDGFVALWRRDGGCAAFDPRSPISSEFTLERETGRQKLQAEAGKLVEVWTSLSSQLDTTSNFISAGQNFCVPASLLFFFFFFPPCS